MKEKRKMPRHNSILRLVFVGISILLQVLWMLLLTQKLNEYSTVISFATGILAFSVVLRLYSKHTTSAMKTPWIMLILVFPVMGLSLYCMVEFIGAPIFTRKRLSQIRTVMEGKLPQDPGAAAELCEVDPGIGNQFRYLMEYVGAPVHRDTDVKYYAEATDALADLKQALERAERFIFMEYFIVEDAESFREIREILVRKAKAGVEVRLMYDDIGSIGYVNLKFAKKLRDDGIQCRVFNPAIPVFNLSMNHRDHRKITVVDGKVGFTGGYNLANEYFGLSHPYGQWKDTGLRLEGSGVRSLTALFLELWNLGNAQDHDPSSYLDASLPNPGAKGFVLPFGDDPLGKERAAENMHMNMIAQAKRSIWFITPYLIITDEMRHALGLAAKRGVDVRIITPGIPDKKVIYQMTRSYYNGLAIQGVRIYEYAPGFCHAKECICDGEIASVGTSNLDFRSLYHHFENNVLLYGTDAIRDIQADFEALFPQCREVTETYRSGRSAILRTTQLILRLFAPLV